MALPQTRQSPRTRPAQLPQLRIAFEPTELRGMTVVEQAAVLKQLVVLLLQAANVQTDGADDDER